MKILALIMAFFVFSAKPVHAELITIGQGEIRFQGLFRNPDGDQIPDGANTKFDNVYIEDGDIHVVKGRDRLNNTANADTTVNGLFYYENAAGTTKKYVLAETDELVTYDTDGTSRTQIASGLTNSKWDAVQVADTLYLTNETDGLYKWTGSGSATAITGVSAPSSVDFSATSNAGGLTPGNPAVVVNKIGTQKNGDSSNTICADDGTGAMSEQVDDNGGNNHELWYESTRSQSVACGSLSSTFWATTCATDSDYKYKITKHNNVTLIESEASASDTAAVTGNDTVTYSCGRLAVSVDQEGATCPTTLSFENQGCWGPDGFEIEVSGFESQTTGTLAAAPSSPFNEYCVYRTVAGGSEYFLVGCQDTGAFVDGKPDAALGTLLDTTRDTITPPSYRYIEEYKGVLFVLEKNSLRFGNSPVSIDDDVDKFWLESDELIVGTASGTGTGLKKTANSLLIFSNNSIQELTGFGIQSFRLRTLIEGVGAVSDETIESDTNGDIIFFSGVEGVYKLGVGRQDTDDLLGSLIDSRGAQLTKISSPALDDIFQGVDDQVALTTSNYSSAHAYYDQDNDFYFLYVDGKAFLYDNANAAWSHITGTDMEASVYRQSGGQAGQGFLVDDVGIFYDNFKGYTTGAESGTVTGNPTSGTASTLTDTGASFFTTGSGLTGQWVVTELNGVLEYQEISSNTATVITIGGTFTTTPTTSHTYYVGYVIPEWQTKQYNFAVPPRQTRVESISIVHNKADATQNLIVEYFRNKGTTREDSTPPTIDLSTAFEHDLTRIGISDRGYWIQFGFRTFVYNTSNTISPPVDIINNGINVVQRDQP